MLNLEKRIVAGCDPQVAREGQADATAGAEVPEQTKVLSQPRLEANRRNAQRSTGPKNTDRTRLNALKHGLRAEGLTPLDDAEDYEQIINELTLMHPPRNRIDELWIRRAALEMVRLSRNAGMEAQTLTVFVTRPDPLADPTADQYAPGIDPTIMKEYAGPLLDRLQRYDSAIMNRLIRCLRQLERIPIEKAEQRRTDTNING